MNTDELLAENQRLKALLEQQSAHFQTQLKTKQNRIQQLEEILLSLKRKQFGSSSEKLDQLPLFNEAEAELSLIEASEAPVQTDSSPTSKSSQPRRQRLPEELPREEVIYELPAEQRQCPHDGSELIEIGEESSEQLEIIPAQVKVIRHRRKKYACPCCQQHVVTADKPKAPIPKSIAAPGLLAYILTQKYQDALPLYRQSQIFERLGVHLQRSTLSEWVVKCGQLVQPLINLIQERIHQQPVIHMDETPLQVLNEAGKPAQSQSYMWVQRAGPPDKGWIYYHYSDTRSGDVPKQLLDEFQGTLMTDGYSGYNAVCQSNGIQRLACWAHVRRKFMEAKQVQAKGKTGRADLMLKWIQQLYRIEKQAKDNTTAQRYTLRQKKAKPIIEKIQPWLDEALLVVPPKTALGNALSYTQKQWPQLIAYLDDGHYPIDNNPVENAIRPFALGRKNWLFANTPKGAKASANLYSLIETAKAHGIEPYAYLKLLLTKLPNADTVEQIEALMPEHCKDGV